VHHSYPEHRIGPEEVIVSSGCSGALEIALTSLLDPGTVLLVPQPSFPLYQMIAESHGATVVHYRLRRDTWECDMTHLQDLMIQYQNVRAIVINNPSGATGTVFSELHLVNLLDFALVHRLPIVSDEVFGDMTFGSKQFYPLAQVAAKTRSQVPILTTSGLSKQFLLSGWRVGWLTFHDK
jgi:tyrosine aminotransferase